MINFIIQLRTWLKSFYQQLFGRRAAPLHHPVPAAPRPRYVARFLSDDADLPRELDRTAVYVIGSGGNEWLAVMLCPCGCKSRISLNLLPDEKPRWKWRVDARAEISLHPSVWRDIGCKSHFILRDGVVNWVRD